MKVDVVNMEGQKVKTVELPSAIFEAPINVDLMHQAFVRQMANARLGTRKTKGRSEVSGGGRKPWRQKGTGRARQGSIRAAQWVGGGKVHTPKPKDFSQSMPKKMRQAAIRSALSVKAADNELLVLDSLELPEIKTRLMAQALDRLVGESSALIVLPEKNDSYQRVVLSTNNIPDAKTVLVNYLNIRDLLGYERLIIPVPVIAQLETLLAN
ncbi:MAG: 50S ribosomal protein L4 [Anaerolineales bacterium]|nr:50S ribosomal protein L4 [Anaerolineales bacterium]